MLICNKCQNEIEPPERIGRKDTCPHCGAELHCCSNCKFYDRGAHNQCREPNSDWVLDREKGNFCDYFSFTDKAQKAPGTGGARTKAEALFRKK